MTEQKEDPMQQLEKIQAEVCEIWNGFSEDQYKDNEKLLKLILRRCREEQASPEAAFVHHLTALDRRLCIDRDIPSNEAFHLYYHSALPLEVIARKMMINKRTVWKHIKKTRRRMMILTFGIDGLIR